MVNIKQLVLFFAFISFFISEGQAQSSRDSESDMKFTSTSSSAVFSSSKKSSKKFFKKRKSKGNRPQSLVEYEKLKKDVQKAQTKKEKGMRKPQYSDPSYFGHKRPPKKRKLGKRKFCKECGMTH
ncbi:MAG: hypothetical protein JXR07_12955 [Reichenbachiella sp.]